MKRILGRLFFRGLFCAALAATGWNGMRAVPVGAESPRPNHLIHEKSPYLIQHAFNPVDWYPWGPEAFAKARRENKPIFLSIGYSTCHWCHVMERESFADPGIGRLLNDNFVSIKVDREERPDLDRIYLDFVQNLTGGGGWPMSVWLTPGLKPFFGGGYFAPDDRSGRPGFKTVLARIARQWATEPGALVNQADKLTAALAADVRTHVDRSPSPIAELRNGAFRQLRDAFDPPNGGFGGAPKFPLPARLEFLLDVAGTSRDRAQRAAALDMALGTLRGMADGGIHDQLGGGFHRYAIDERWRMPHFEKMLSDQAQLANVYLEAWQISAEPGFRDTASDILDLVQRELSDAGGGFYSAEDSDSAWPGRESVRVEGAFYLWRAAEIEATLGPADAPLFEFAFGVKPAGNLPSGADGGFSGWNVLYRAHPVAEVAAKFRLTREAAAGRLDSASSLLRTVRGKRPLPPRDDKIVTAGNGLMISAFSRAAQILHRPEYAAAAERSAAFLQASLYDPASGRLARSYRAGGRSGAGFAEDYAFLIQGLLDLYETDFDVRWLEWALQLQEKQNELFGDPVAGGFFASARGDADSVPRLKDDGDGAEPSANSIAVRNLARLAEMFQRDDWHNLAVRTVHAFGPQLQRDPAGLPQLLASAGWLEGSPEQILIHGEGSGVVTRALVTEVWRRFLPRRVLLRVDRESAGFFKSRVPFVADLPAIPEGTAMAYVCENFVCRLPTRDPAALAARLARETPGGR